MSAASWQGLRVLVVGGGSIGGRHLRNLAALGVGELALAEPDAARREVLCRETGSAGFAGLDDGLAWRPQVVVIASPSPAHPEQALTVVRQGLCLFVEKPLAASQDGLDALEVAAHHGGMVTMVACNMRFHPGPATVKRLLEGGAIGTVLSARLHTGSYLPHWRPAQDYRASYSASTNTGGAILDCIHEIDLALWYFGSARLLASAVQPARSLGLETDGLAELLLSHKAGALSSVHLNFLQRDYRRTCQVIGTEGTLSWDFAEGLVVQYGPGGDITGEWRQPADWDINQMYRDEMTHFLECVLLGGETINPLAGGRAALALALAARRPENALQ